MKFIHQPAWFGAISISSHSLLGTGYVHSTVQYGTELFSDKISVEEKVIILLFKNQTFRQSLL
jgi:hypothetical protein